MASMPAPLVGIHRRGFLIPQVLQAARAHNSNYWESLPLWGGRRRHSLLCLGGIGREGWEWDVSMSSARAGPLPLRGDAALAGVPSAAGVSGPAP